MSNTQKILGVARTSLAAQQAAIAVTGNNIANVNTEGYTRRRADLEQVSSQESLARGQVGSGVRFAGATPIVDQYLERQLSVSRSEREKASVEESFLSRVGSLFSLTGESPTIGSAMTDFFSAVNALSSSPTSYELRFNMLERANTLAETIRSTMGSLASIQSEANNRLVDEIKTVNSLTSQIADLNGRIVGRERSTGTVAADERDQREILLQKLSDKMSFSRTDSADGSVMLSLANGFPIVLDAQARELEVTNTPSFGGPTQATALDGSVLNYVVFDFDDSTTTTHLDFTRTLQAGGGSIGGLLTVRGYANATDSALQANGDIVSIAQRVEAIARDLLTTFNTEYLGPDEDAGTAGFQYSARDLDGNAPTEPFAFFTFPSSVNRDAVADLTPTTGDLNALGRVSYASILSVAITDPRRIAAARDSNPVAGAVSFQEGNSDNLRALFGLRDSTRTFAAGNYSRATTYDENYNEMLADAGNRMAAARVSLSVSDSKLAAVVARREELSGVSLDEEFSKLILYQKAYEASARMIRTATQLLDEVIQLI